MVNPRHRMRWQDCPFFCDWVKHLRLVHGKRFVVVFLRSTYDQHFSVRENYRVAISPWKSHRWSKFGYQLQVALFKDLCAFLCNRGKAWIVRATTYQDLARLCCCVL